jgi:hypothetical protein
MTAGPSPAAAGRENVCEVFGGREVRSGVLVQQTDASGAGGPHGGVDVAPAGGRG